MGSLAERSNATGVNGNQADNSLIGAGAAYVFVRTGTNWVQSSYLKALNTDAQDAFGVAVAVATDTVVVGEVGLAGEIRAVAQLPQRIQEAAALGFRRCIVPSVDLQRWRGEPAALPLEGVSTVMEALIAAGISPSPSDRSPTGVR